MRYTLDSMLPERAFSPRLGRGFGAGGMTLEGGGGGSPPPPPPAQPTSTTVQNTNIPEYLRPYAETMLGATQQQLFNTSTNADGTTQITGVKPYVPYSQDPSKYIAGFSPLQEQAMNTTANLKTPMQYQDASQMAAMSGVGALQAGRNYAMQATDPRISQAYMSPYLQASLNPQLQEIQRQYDITGTQQQGQATAAGAFGGSRGAIMDAENQRNKNMAMNQAIGQGYNNAFQQAQQAQQFGANLGLQGLGQGASAANTLGGLGGQQLAAQQGIAQSQMTAGTAEQQQQQNIINQAIQNYATAQQYPQQQLSFMNAMLRGLPTQSTTTQNYQAAPSTLNQMTGLGIAGLGAYKAFGGSGT
jgi:hypothetical protein